MQPRLEDFNPFLPAIRQDPFPYYELLQEQAPLHWIESLKMFAVSRYDDVMSVLKNPAVFSSQGLRLPGAAGNDAARTSSLINTDPPAHTRLRNIVNRAFTPRRIEEMAPRIRELAREFVTKMTAHDEFDLIHELGAPLPVVVIAEMLGVEASRREDFKRWSDDIVAVTDQAFQGKSTAGALESQRALAQYMGAIIEQRMREPREDIISLVAKAGASEDGLNADEMISFARLLLIAGNETTTNLIGNAMNLLVRHPEQLAWLVKNPAGIPAALEEVLRFEGPAHLVIRTAVEDAQLSGGTVPKGSRVVVLLGAANRDPRKFKEPNRFDIRREPSQSMAFGYGVHFCLGAPLARLEGKVALEELFAKAPALTFSPRQPDQIEWLSSAVVRGPKYLWLKRA